MFNDFRRDEFRFDGSSDDFFRRDVYLSLLLVVWHNIDSTGAFQIAATTNEQFDRNV